MEFATININEHETTFVKKWVLSYNIATVDLDPKATENHFPFAFSFLLSVNIPLSVGKRTTTFYRPQGKVMFSQACVILFTISLMATRSLLVTARSVRILSECFLLIEML